jgi:hypothetical protein
VTEHSGPSPIGSCRPVLIGIEAFRRLRGIQISMPQPRLDMRYLVEGSIDLLHAQPGAMQRWLKAARDELARDLRERADRDGGDAVTQEPGSARATGQGTGDQLGAEGAEVHTFARVRGARRAWNAERSNCKSLLLAHEVFQRLRAVQGTTRNPRLELIYLVDGAVALLHQDQASHAAWVRQSRQALASHLVQLNQLSLSNHLEMKT